MLAGQAASLRVNLFLHATLVAYYKKGANIMTYTDQEKTDIIASGFSCSFVTTAAAYDKENMYRMRRLRTDDLPLGKDILPSGSGRKTHLHRQRV